MLPGLGKTLAVMVLSSLSAGYTVWHLASKGGSGFGGVAQAGQAAPQPNEAGAGDGARGNTIEADLAAVHLQNVDLSLQLQLLQQQVDRLQTRLDAHAVAASEVEPVESSAEFAGASLQETPEAQEANGPARKNEHRERFALLEEAFFAEALDPEWSATMDSEWSRIEGRLQQHTAGSTSIEYSECRGSTCRVEFTHANRAPALMPALIASSLNSQVVLRSVTENGTEKTIAIYQK